MAGPKEQPLPPDVIGRDDATEVLRAFVLVVGASCADPQADVELQCHARAGRLVSVSATETPEAPSFSRRRRFKASAAKPVSLR